MKNIIVDNFKTSDGKIYKLVKLVNGEYLIVRNFIIFHTCESLSMATEKFYKIKELLRIDGQLIIMKGGDKNAVNKR